MLWVAGFWLSELFVNWALPVSGPLVVGAKARLRLQLAPCVSVVEAVQSAGVPLPATWVKFVPMIRPDSTRLALPMFSMVTDCAALVLATLVFGKLRVGGWESCNW